MHVSLMLKVQTAGESHGQALLAILSGVPAGLVVDADFVTRELRRRQGGYGRGGRMRIESDMAQFLAGVRQGQTIGAPIAILIENRDWGNWKGAMAVERAPESPAKNRPVASPRPGHADLAGCLTSMMRVLSLNAPARARPRFAWRQEHWLSSFLDKSELRSRVTLSPLAVLHLVIRECRLTGCWRCVTWKRSS